ncbi:MAG: phenylalanine 4-monooxygenase [Alphaproteobacteria bacterium]|nr:MAG: phenylalanine 4-monooxygenase [Alphaproteobacteria bacterium]
MTPEHSPTPKSTRADYTIDQAWETYTAEEHDIWRLLYERQMKLLPGRAVDEFLHGVDVLGMSSAQIPDFADLNDKLAGLTGWQVVAVPDLVPDEVFFEHLANKRFPAGRFIRRRSQLDYLEEPDIFHDVFGHVPLLADPVFSAYMEAYGKGGLRALGRNVLNKLARLYWYTVEFGLIETEAGLRIYGAGILSSKSESIFCLEDASPNRIRFNLERLLQTHYRIDDFQEVYFVIDSFKQLFDETYQDFGPIYDRLEGLPEHKPFDIVEGDAVLSRGTGAYAAARLKESA